MGGNRRYAAHPISIPTWASTVARMKADEVRVSASCRGRDCGFYKRQIDFDRLIAAGHANLCLFDYHPPCPRGCGAGILFAFSPGVGTPFRPCITLRR